MTAKPDVCTECSIEGSHLFDCPVRIGALEALVQELENKCKLLNETIIELEQKFQKYREQEFLRAQFDSQSG